MTTPAWQPGTLYLPGALVVPRSTPAPQPVAIVNGDLEAGTTAWNFGGNVVLDTGFRFAGTNSLRVNGTGDITLLNTTAAACTQGQVVKASCMYHQGSAGEGENTGRVLLQFLDGASAVLSTVQGNVITSSSGGWKKSSVTGVAPANTAFVKIGAFSHKTKSAEHQFDAFQWDVSSVTQGLMYKAVQAAAGTSDDVEPAWPTTLGVTVVDNTVTWEAVAISRIVWSPQAAMVSGATEPTWPTGMGTRVADGQVAWEAIPRRIEDENCPHSKVVVIASSKVYAADDDVVRYSATVNPYDWSTANDAGYLPYGLQQYGANPIAAMGLYRSNLVIFNAQAFQMWQVDEDPANSALLDALPIGSTWHKALAPVSNDLFFNSAQGVRTVSIAGGSTNLAAGDVGMPIDPLVQDAMATATANTTKALATYVPSAGQYWLAFSDYPPPAVSITGDIPDGQEGQFVSGAYTVTGGMRPYGDVTVTAGTFPPGLTLNPDGSYAGTYTTVGSYAWTVGVTDANGAPATVADAAVVAAVTVQRSLRPKVVSWWDFESDLLDKARGGNAFTGAVTYQANDTATGNRLAEGAAPIKTATTTGYNLHSTTNAYSFSAFGARVRVSKLTDCTRLLTVGVDDGASVVGAVCIGITDGKWTARIYTTDGATVTFQAQAPATATLNADTHVGLNMVYGGATLTTLELWVNGVKVASHLSGGGIYATRSHYVIGTYEAGGYRPAVAEMFWAHDALTEAEWLWLHNGGSKRFYADFGSVAYGTTYEAALAAAVGATAAGVYRLDGNGSNSAANPIAAGSLAGDASFTALVAAPPGIGAASVVELGGTSGRFETAEASISINPLTNLLAGWFKQSGAGEVGDSFLEAGPLWYAQPHQGRNRAYQPAGGDTFATSYNDFSGNTFGSGTYTGPSRAGTWTMLCYAGVSRRNYPVVNGIVVAASGEYGADLSLYSGRFMAGSTYNGSNGVTGHMSALLYLPSAHLSLSQLAKLYDLGMGSG